MSANPSNVYSFPFRGALPQWDERQAGHTVHLYESDNALLQELANFVASALEAGNSAVLVCTEGHHLTLDQLLQVRRVDLAQVGREGRYLVLDAQRTLSTVFQSGSADGGRLAASVENAIKQAAAAAKARQPRVAAFDEMAAILYAEGQWERAIEVEQLWTDLLQSEDFDLHCAYPIAAFRGQEHAELLERICSRHRRVVPAESYAGLHIEDTRLRHVALLQQKAQSLETERKRARQVLNERDTQLRVGEEHLRFIQKAAGIASWELDLHTGKYLWSPEAFEMFGLQEHGVQPSQRDLLALMYFSTDRDNFQRALKAARSKNREYKVQFRIRRQDGEVRWILARGRLYHTRETELMLGIFLDVTESR